MTGPRIPRHITIATNNGEIGGGEVMLLRLSEAFRALGIPVTVVAPSYPDGIANAARAAGFDTVVLPARDRGEWMRRLRGWDAHERRGLLWCNGLVPATATAGHRNRIVHLHQLPSGVLQAAAAIARSGALATVVPSAYMSSRLTGTHALANWTPPFADATHARPAGAPFTVGFLGRLSPAKGVVVLAEAMRALSASHPSRYRMILAGAPIFVETAAQAEVAAALAPISAMTEQRGWVDPAALFSDIDLLVVPSVWSEPFGLVAAEAMAARVPVLVSDAGALPEVVGAEHGLIVPAGDPGALARAITAIERRELVPAVEALHTRWCQSYSPTAGVGRVRDLVHEIGRTRPVS